MRASFRREVEHGHGLYRHTARLGTTCAHCLQVQSGAGQRTSEESDYALASSNRLVGPTAQSFSETQQQSFE